MDSTAISCAWITTLDIGVEPCSLMLRHALFEKRSAHWSVGIEEFRFLSIL
jgi:hypothetical protein